MSPELGRTSEAASEQDGLVRSPSRTDSFAAALALASAMAWVVMVGIGGWPRFLVAAVLALGGLEGLRRGNRDAAALALATAALAALMAMRIRVIWPGELLAVVGGLLVAYRLKVPWFRRGVMNGAIVAWSCAVVAISAGALLAWWAIFHPDLTDLAFPPWLRSLHPAVVALLLLGWASLNAVAEEFFFRGAMQHALVDAIGPAGVLVQAMAFGVAHLHGVPRGAIGVVLATIYGLMMGALRVRARGMLAPWAAHVVADVVVVAILAVGTR